MSKKKEIQLNNISLNETYVLILFPDVQEYIEKEWFNNEAVLCTVDSQGHNLSEEYSAYFIPIKYINRNE